MAKSLAYWAFETLNSKLNPNSASIALKDYNSSLGVSSSDYPSKAPLLLLGTRMATYVAALELSAFEDPRFPAISSSELPLLSVSVTLLDNFEPIDDPNDWEIGVHGLKVKFSANGRHFLGTFLPVVAEEQEWDKKETLWNLLRKAGYSGVSRAGTLDFYNKGITEGWMDLTRYEGLKCGLDYKEYVAARKELEG
ncbi:CIC11C00000001987 [Sungouiella intermedia]|uniref:CIC11C00000001987 n=1 Tax=Sungouiella intermedia TaxID=45354 RepID=A0A1L0BTL8_9ASCO|nr:CIC11C00000001987 [[Candida] intermedia]